MSAPIPTIEPASFRAGDTVKWTKSLADYLPADGWVLYYAFANATTTKTVTCTDNGDGSHLATLSKADSAGYTAGHWSWQAYVELSGERFTVATGTVEVLPVLTTATDARSLAQVCLDNIEAYLKDSNNITAAKFTYNNRSLDRWPRDQLHAERMKLRREVKAEETAQRAAAGLPGKNQIRVRL